MGCGARVSPRWKSFDGGVVAGRQTVDSLKRGLLILKEPLTDSTLRLEYKRGVLPDGGSGQGDGAEPDVV